MRGGGKNRFFLAILPKNSLWLNKFRHTDFDPSGSSAGGFYGQVEKGPTTKAMTDLVNKIYDVYNERQDENWDGYGAEPLKFLPQSLKFAESLSSESRLLVESVDIIPENDGCLCFEWYKSNEKNISVSVKGEKLIYNYEIDGMKDCGETNFCGKKDIIEKMALRKNLWVKRAQNQYKRR